MNQVSWILPKCLGIAMLDCARELLGSRRNASAMHQRLPEIAVRVWEDWGRRTDERTRIQDLEATARAVGKVRPYVELLVQDMASEEPESIRLALRRYLSAVPSAIRRTLRRPEDPKGWTAPPWFVLREPRDVISFLPSQIPMFEPGDRPLPDVDWELTDLLGAGGFGEVWKAQNPTFQSVPPVVLKFFFDPQAGDRAFRHEAALLTQAMPKRPHRGLVELRATYMKHHPPCLEFECVEGGDLITWFRGHRRQHGPISARLATRLILRLARIVGYFHRRNPPIAHRDLKPANILIRRLGRGRMELKICDFGIGGLVNAGLNSSVAANGAPNGEEIASRRLIQQTTVKGWYTPIYASPQQIKGNAPDPRDDVHALGVIWLQLLANDLSLPAPNGAEWPDALNNHKLSAAQIELLGLCFHPRADLRIPNANVMAQEIAARFPNILTSSPRSHSAAAATRAKNSESASKPQDQRGLVNRLKFWT